MSRESSTTYPNPLGQYLESIRMYPLLTQAEEILLAQQIEQGLQARQQIEEGKDDAAYQSQVADGLAAKEDFINSNLRLVVSIAKTYYLPKGIELMDLIQEGNIGLERSVDLFNWRSGLKFSGNATWRIRNNITREVRKQNGVIRIPAEKRAVFRAALMAAHGDPDKLTPEARHIYNVTNTRSIFEPVGENAVLEDFIADERVVAETEAINEVYGSNLEQEVHQLLEETERLALVTPVDQINEVDILTGLSKDKRRGLVTTARSKLQHPSSGFSAQESWTQVGNCYGIGTSNFFITRGEDTRVARKICQGCVIASNCIMLATEKHLTGIWGATSEKERRQFRSVA